MVLSRALFVPTIHEGLRADGRLVKTNLPLLQAAVKKLDPTWNVSMFPKKLRDETDIAYDAVRQLLKDMGLNA